MIILCVPAPSQSMGFTPEEQSAIWKVIAAILHLGNVELASNKDGETSCVADMGQLTPIAKVLGECVGIQVCRSGHVVTLCCHCVLSLMCCH